MDPSQHFNALNKHDMLHWYEIQAILGQGGFGITYLAKDTNLDQMVAIKEYLPTEFSTRDAENTVQPISENHTEVFEWGKRRFLDEAKTLAQFKHPNVVRVNSFFENNNTGYMVMDYEEGTDLSAKIKAGESFDERRLLDILLPILDGLKQIHAQGFIHRDIKPANIFIREDGSPVLIDFGSARQAVEGQTRTMTSLVTPGYAPFEQYHDAEGKQGPWTDIYSLGATCYSAITGKPPIDALKRGMARIDHSIDAYLSLHDLSAGKYNDYFLRAIDHALEFKESDRPQTVTEWQAMLTNQLKIPVIEESQANVVTEINAPPSAAISTETEIDFPITEPDKTAVMTQVKPDRKPSEQVNKTEAPGEKRQQVEEAPASPGSPQPPKPTANKSIYIVPVLVIAVIVGVVLFLMPGEEPQPVIESVDTTELQLEQSESVAEMDKKLEPETITSEPSENISEQELTKLEAEKAALKMEQARIEAEKQALKQEQVRLAEEEEKRKAANAQKELEIKQQAEKKRQQELARQQAEKKRQQAIAAKKLADEKLARAKLAEEKRQAELSKARQSQVIAGHTDLSGTFVPDEGFEDLKLVQNGNKIKGSIGTNGSTLEGTINGNRIEFTFRYSLTGFGFKKGTGEFEISPDGNRLTGSRYRGGFPNRTAWNLTRDRKINAAKNTAASSALNVSGTYAPDEGFEYLELVHNGNKIKGSIGNNGSTLEGTIDGNHIEFTFRYSRTGYGFKDGVGEFTVSADGKRLTGSRFKGGFAKRTAWNFTKEK